MIVESLYFFGKLYVDFFFSLKMVLLIGFVGIFTTIVFALGFNRTVFSRNAIMNTLTTLAILALNIALAPAIYVISKAMLAAYQDLGIPSVPESYWSTWHWLPVALFAFVARDFADYWSHRAMHTKIGWPIHAVHHSDTHVNGFTTFRVHVLEIFVMKVFTLGVTAWLGLPAEAVAAMHVVGALHNAYVHFEVDIDHGPLNWLIASPRFHRWHHADFAPAYGKNLANAIPAWDMLFGTYYKAGPCTETMGAEREGISGTDPVRLMLLPFVLWLRMAQKSISGLMAVKKTHIP